MLPGIRAGARVRAAIAFGVIAIGIVALGVPSRAARLVDVRLGTHKGYTRVVLETDAPVAYRLDPSAKELRVAVDAKSRAGAVARVTPQVSAVRVQPTGSTTEVHIELKQRVEVRQLVLKGPDRVVLDLYPAAAEAAPAPAPSAPTAAAPPPAPSRPAPTLPPPADEDLAAADAEIPPPEPVPGAPATGTAREPAQSAEPVAPPAPLEPGAPTEEAPALGEAVAPETAAPEAIEPEPAPTEASEEPARPHVVSRPPEPQEGMGLVDLLLSPAGLGALAAVFLGLFAWLRIRARRATEAEAAELSPYGPEAEEGEQEAALPVGHAAAEQPGEEDQSSLFDVGEEEVAAAPAAPAARGIEAEAAGEAPPAAWVEEVGEEMARIIQELERRVGHLETRLEEVVDAKERLERQVSAQTEELRVQRAAIARTQRVLRTVARPEDEASEPAPKA